MAGESENLVNFVKYQSGGDNFVIVDNTKKQYTSFTDNGTLIARMLDKDFGIGGNALLELLPCEDYDYEMVYYNAKGMREGLCGNGSLCVAAFIKETQLFSGNKFSYKGSDGPHQVHVLGQRDGVFSAKIELLKTSPKFDTFDDTDAFMMVGDKPHFYRFVKNLDSFPVIEEGVKLVYRKEFQGEKSAHANFVELGVSADGLPSVKLRTYDRELKGEILACGTASTGAALISYYKELQKKNGLTMPNVNKNEYQQIQVQSPGGTRDISFKVDNDGQFSDIWLLGETQKVFSGQFVVRETM